MPEKYKRIIKIIVIVCVLVLLFDIGYLIYITYFKKTEKTYFDSINMVEITNEGYIAVGSNNNNEKSYEKAKITQYDQDKNKVWEKLYNKGYNGSFFAVKKMKMNTLPQVVMNQKNKRMKKVQEVLLL